MSLSYLGLPLAGLDMAQSIASWPVPNARIFLNGKRLLLHGITGYCILLIALITLVMMAVLFWETPRLLYGGEHSIPRFQVLY